MDKKANLIKFLESTDQFDQAKGKITYQSTELTHLHLTAGLRVTYIINYCPRSCECEEVISDNE